MISINNEVYQNFNPQIWTISIIVIILFEMSEHREIRIQEASDRDRSWIKAFYQERWGSSRVVSRGELHEVASLSGFIALKADNRIGLLCYQIKYREFEIVTLDSLVEGIGVGSALIKKALESAQAKDCQRVWLITTNDNTPALHFYQKRGFKLVAIYPNGLDRSRKLKPEIPQFGLDGIPLRDEIELEFIINR